MTIDESFLSIVFGFLSLFIKILQRRNTGKLDFMKRWRQYMQGFGELTDEFWLGTKNKSTMKVYKYTFCIDMKLKFKLNIKPVGKH